MNIKEIINDSGLLEEYVLGQLNPTEMAGVECLAKTYPEIQEEIKLISESLGKFYGSQEKAPPAYLKDKIFSQMTFDEPLVDEEKEEIIAISIPKNSKVLPLWPKLAVAASVLLALGSVFLVFKKNDLESKNMSLNTNVNDLQGLLGEKEKTLLAFQNIDNKIVTLKGTEKQASSSVSVFWNQKDNNVLLSVGSLPKPEKGKQYQLWYIGEKGPVDMGMLPTDFDGKLLTMKTVNGKPAAFAITLEKEGGVQSPTLEQLYVIGNV